VKARTPWIVVLLGAVSACARLPGPVPLPPQQGGSPPALPAHYVFFREPEASRLVVSGISGEIIDDWRWARRRVLLRLSVDETQGIFFQAVLTVPEEFVRAGGSRIDVRIRGKMLGSIPADRPGYIAWRQAVPEEWLEAGRSMEVELVADAEWMRGNTPRSYILSSAGFTL
jgi:hypothetical protein